MNPLMSSSRLVPLSRLRSSDLSRLLRKVLVWFSMRVSMRSTSLSLSRYACPTTCALIWLAAPARQMNTARARYKAENLMLMPPQIIVPLSAEANTGPVIFLCFFESDGAKTYEAENDRSRSRHLAGRDLQQVAARIAHVEAGGSLLWPWVGNNLHARFTKSFFRRS